MWAHQYLQAVNEINAIKADPHVWQHDGDMAETYGLEPNFGCCTANFNQGRVIIISLSRTESYVVSSCRNLSNCVVSCCIDWLNCVELVLYRL